MNMKKTLPILGVIVIALLLPLVINGPYQLHVLIMIGISVMLAGSLRSIFNSGQLSLGHGGMMTFGAYTTALLITKLGVSTWLALLAGAAAGALLALLVGYPFMRLKGIYFSLVTVFLAEVIRLIAEQWRSLTQGSMGISNIPGPDAIAVFGLFNITFDSKVSFYYLTVILVLITLGVLYAIERSRVGLTWFTVRESDTLAESLGIDTASSKVLSFCIGSFFAGLAGGLFCQYNSIITPSAFGFTYAMYVLIYMIVGGSRRFSGPIIGALIMGLIPEIARPLKEYQPYIFGGVVILVMFFLPGGVVSLPSRFRLLFKGSKDDA